MMPVEKLTRHFAVIFMLMIFATGVHGQLKADFTADKFTGCAPIIVNFTDLSTGSPDSWSWDFGNGTPVAILQNPGTTYLKGGVYNVTLTVKRTSTGETSKITKPVTILSPPYVDFVANDSSGCFPLGLKFTDRTIAQGGKITSWTWDFGDGTVVNDQNPTHTYTLTGKFNVLLKVSQDNGCPGSLTKTAYIDVAQGVNADFYTLPPAGCKPPFTIQFKNISTGPGNLIYSWDFGNGQTSNQKEDIAIYPSGGAFPVKLKVTSDKGCSATVNRSINMPTSTIKSSFTAPDTVCLGQNVNFDNTSQPDPDSSFWSFGDGTTSQLLIPVNKSFGSTGTFQVTLINKFGACLDSFSKTIVVPAPPVINFTSTGQVSCKVPYTVTLKDATPNAIAWNWQATNGINSIINANGISPTMTFTELGNYAVYLYVVDKLGCTSSTTYPDFIKIAAPKIELKNYPDSGCAPFTTIPDLKVNAIDGVKSYTWDWGDQTTTTGNPASHSYPNTGTYNTNVRIITNSGCDTLISPGPVKVGTLPVKSDFTSSTQNSCAGTDIVFTDITADPSKITGWQWAFGDGFYSNERNPKYAYSDTGTFTVTLKVFANGCGSIERKENFIKNYGTVARFNFTVDCQNRNTVVFQDSSINATKLVWDFKDGSPTYTGANPPPHSFPEYKDYFVELTATNNSCAFTTNRRVRVVNERSDFLITPNPLCKGVAAGFFPQNSLDSNIVSYEWDFGSGNYVLGERTAQSAFINSGLFNTRLRITDVNGCVDTSSKPLGVGGPKASFGSFNPTGCKGIVVDFNDNSQTDGANPIITRIWDFGDGTGAQIINTPPFQHQYLKPGSFSVKLKIIDAGGCADSLNIGGLVVISEPKAQFNTTDTLTCPGGRAVQFDNQTGGTVNNFTWTFGDGTTSNLRNPLHFYNNVGVFDIKLKIRDRYGCEDSLIKYKLVKVDTPYAAFTMSDSVGNCPPLKVDFKFTGRYQQSLRWEFGDNNVSDLINAEHFYTRAKIYTPKLIVTSPGGCTSTAEKTISIFGPDGNILFSPPGGCEPLTVQFSATTLRDVDYIAWDFGDGLIKTKDSIQVHSYMTNGIYYPVISLISDKLDCSVAFKLDSIKVIKLFPKIAADKLTICKEGVIQFHDSTTSVGIINGWQWDFGDGSTSDQKDPSHYYSSAGLYTVKLIVATEFGCTDSITLPDPIRVVAPPTIDINASLDSVCQNALISFKGIETIKDTSNLSWDWNLGNGQFSSLQEPPAQQYGTPGTPTIQLVATNSSGCKDTTQKTITIMSLPPTKAPQDTFICKGQAIQLVATGADRYQWQPPGNNLSCLTCADPVADPPTNSLYIVAGFTTFGCMQKDSINLTVIQPSTVKAPEDDSLCFAQALKLIATGTEVYQWSPSTGLSDPNIPNPQARPSTTTTYVVTGSDSKNCFTSKDSVLIKVFPYPKLFIGSDTTISVGASLPILASVSSDVLGIKWDPASTLSCSDCYYTVAKPPTSTTYKVTVINDGGCETTDEITVNVICNNSNIYMPNTFSPNGDGMNDLYYPRGHGIQNIRSLRIFSRWGQMLYSRQNFNANDESAAWDGRFKSQDLTPDVYVYIMELICENGSVITTKGDITLIR